MTSIFKFLRGLPSESWTLVSLPRTLFSDPITTKHGQYANVGASMSVPASVSYVNNPLRASLAPDGCKGIQLNHCHPLDSQRLTNSPPCNRQLILL